MFIQDIKTKFFSILSEDLEYKTKDHAKTIDEKNFPNISLNVASIKRIKARDNIVTRINFKLDIFSLYNGEKEILDMESAIFDKLDDLYSIDGVVFVGESTFRILDDKSTGVVMKHGVGTYNVLFAGTIEEVEDETDPSSESGG